MGREYTQEEFLGIPNINGEKVKPITEIYQKKINMAAKAIYNKINPEYKKKYVSFWDRFVLFVFSIFFASMFADKLRDIVADYLNREEDELEKDNFFCLN